MNALVGFGDVLPISTPEIAYVIFVMYFGVIISSWIIAVYASLSSSVNAHAVEFDRIVDNLKAYAKLRLLPNELRVSFFFLKLILFFDKLLFFPLLMQFRFESCHILTIFGNLNWECKAEICLSLCHHICNESAKRHCKVSILKHFFSFSSSSSLSFYIFGLLLLLYLLKREIKNAIIFVTQISVVVVVFSMNLK